MTKTQNIPWLRVSVEATAENLPLVEKIPDCFVEVQESVAPNGGADCGYVIVPQSRSGGPAGDIRLAYMRIRAMTGTTEAPLFMLAGGPGQTVIKDLELLLFQPELLGPVLADRDVVLMEQRGTFRSKPNLDCPEVRSAGVDAHQAGLEGADADALGLNALRTCIRRFEAAGVDLASYNSVESAADVNDVRAALGYEKINFYGGSYATLLGQFVMRQFPDRLATVILDGVDSVTGKSWIENRAVSAQWGLDNLARLCAAQSGCAEAYNIPALVDAAFELFDDGPIRVQVAASGADAAKPVTAVTITAQDFADFVYEMQTSKYGVAALPLALSRLVAGGRDLVGQTLAEQAASAMTLAPDNDENGMPMLMHMAMVCTDDPPRTLDEIKLEGVGRYAKLFAQSKWQEYAQLCGVIDLPQLPASSDAAIRTDIPVLILSGGLDVQTPYFLSEEMARTLPNARNVIFPAGFHVQLANINRCATAVTLAFLRNPAADPNPGCIADEQRLPFVLPQDKEDGSP